ncbi:MAG: L,D-transpeptidase/peptidoglycan binding protein [Coriobacteriales bacterium]|jgi:hypothetical protein|nr:L,D-transpeptidase/peptidoglycan binding protein [Coriobacteriales bacterium]
MKLPLVMPSDGDEDNAHIPPVQSDQNTCVDFLEYDETPEKKRSLLWLWITLGVLFGLILAAYIGGALFFQTHFMFNATVNGIPVTFKTADEVNASLATEIGNYTLDIDARQQQHATIIGSQINLNYEDNGRLAQDLADQQTWLWPLSLIPENTRNIQQVSVKFDQKKLEDKLATFAFMDKDKMKPTVDASLEFEGNAYVISAGDPGTMFDVEKTIREIADAISAGETRFDLEEQGVYTPQKVTADDPTLVADRDRFNKYVPFKITYIIGDKTEVLDGHTTINWVDTAGEGPYVLNNDAVMAYVKDFANRYDTLESTRTIVNGFGEEKQVTGGTFGWMLDQDTEFWEILSAAEQHRGDVRQPYWISEGISFGDNDWGKTYLEVDMTQQYMWYFVDGVCVLETDVITGNPNTGYGTPQGVWSVFIHQMNVMARGDRLPDGTYEWEVPVTYWMQFTYTGCGFHDAYWQPSFGGSYYLWRGSHGCINMPPYLAADLYDIVDIGVPVITHY